jgi:diphthine synthase
MLRIIGLGLDEREITEKGLESLEDAEKAFAEFYTNTANIDLERLEDKTGMEIEELEREEVEQKDRVVEEARESEVAFLVSGDPLNATTHYDIMHRAREKGIEVEVVHAPSIFTSVAETGLNVYRFGRTVTLPRDAAPESVAEHIEKNESIGLHTLVLFDIDYPADEAAAKLTEMGLDPEREAVVLERANHTDQSITVTTLGEAAKKGMFGETPHSLVLTGEKSHKEEEFLEER